MKKKKIIGLIYLIALALSINVFFISGRIYAADDVEDYEEKIDNLEEKKEKTEQQLNTAQTQLQKNQYQLGVTKELLAKTENEMKRKEAEIDNLTKRIELNRKILETYVREVYISGNEPLENFLARDEAINEASENYDQMVGIKEKILLILNEINESKNDVEKAKSELSEKKEDHEQLLVAQKGQEYSIKSDINQAQATLSQVNAKIDKLRSELSKLLGSAVSFKNVLDAAKFASKVTGIRKDYLLGVLVVESNLGKYTGGCTYKESRMSGYRAEVFKNICGELDYDYKKQKVSCPPKSYAGTGGAMGVAQFMPDTWVGYKSSIAAVTGHNPPDPWNLTDGVVAMALKLAKVEGVKAHKKSAEAKAYCIYLAGSNWVSYCDNKGTNYGDLVLYWADNYERLLN